MIEEFTETTPLLSSNQENASSVKENEHFFDKYVINSSKELEQLNQKGKLIGAFVFTYDSLHVGMHKYFYAAQVVKKNLEKIGSCRKKARQIDLNICHAMIIVGWDEPNRRPRLAHSVMDGVKINAVDYFNPIQCCKRKYKTADRLIVYIPNDEQFRLEFAKNAELTAQISTDKDNRSPFCWSRLISCIFQKQICKIPKKNIQNDLAYVMTDILLKRKLSISSNANKARPFFCTEYAVCILQASILTNALTKEKKNELLESAPSRAELAQKIFQRITGSQNETDDPLLAAYWKSGLCYKINPKATISSYAALLFDKKSCIKGLEELK